MVPSSIDRVVSAINPDELCDLALDLCRIPSPTGEEGPLAEFIADWYRKNGLIGIRQEVEAGRANAIGIVRGRGDGPTLMLNGHLDTGTPFRHEQLVGPIPPKYPIMEPRKEGGILYGTGMDNMRSGLAAIMTAARAIKQSGVQLHGDLIIAAVAGEVSRAPVDQYQGHYYRSKGLGTRYLLTHGIVSDYAIVADTSHFALTWAQCGVVYAKITLPGRPVYTPYTRRVANPRESDNAIVKAAILIQALEEWATEYERNNVYRFAGGEVQPRVSIGAIAGGVPTKVANSPIACSLYVDIRTPPGKRPIEVQRELRRCLDSLHMDYELELFLSQMGYEGKQVEPLVDAIRDAHQLVRGRPLSTISSGQNSNWTDTNLYNELGIPAIKFGIGAALRPGLAEVQGMFRIRDSANVEDLINVTKIYAIASMSICGTVEPNGSNP
jgi:acetylornithine deacetylase/succinyl-diaminopimelate desuccinylase-like protein